LLHFSETGNVVAARTASVLVYPLTQAKLHLFHYAGNFVWPFSIRQSPAIVPVTSLLDAQALLGLLAIAASVAAAWMCRRTQPLIAFAIVAYWLLITPTSSVVPLNNLAVDYRPYASSPFLFLLIAALLAHLPVAWLRRGIAVGMVLYVAAASYALNRVWLTEETLWDHAVAHGAEAPAYVNLAMSISDRRDPRVRTSLEEALRLAPELQVARTDLGLLLIDLGESQKGLDLCKQATSMAPSSAQPYYWLSLAYGKLQRPVEAADASAHAARLDPLNLDYQLKAARDAQAVGRYAESLRYLEVVERRHGSYRDAPLLQGLALQQVGKPDEAVRVLSWYVQVQPQSPRGHYLLGEALLAQGNRDGGVSHLRTALRLDPKIAEAHHRLEQLGEVGTTE
jgi:tetratricopeptide (TPR) repeat protein